MRRIFIGLATASALLFGTAGHAQGIVAVPDVPYREVSPQVLLDEAVEAGLLGAATGVGSGSASLRVGGHVGSAA